MVCFLFYRFSCSFLVCLFVCCCFLIDDSVLRFTMFQVSADRWASGPTVAFLCRNGRTHGGNRCRRERRVQWQVTGETEKKVGGVEEGAYAFRGQFRSNKFIKKKKKSNRIESNSLIKRRRRRMKRILLFQMPCSQLIGASNLEPE